MKRTYRKVLLRTMKGTFSRFIAIAAIVALGVGLLAGLMATPINMRAAGDTYFDQSNLFDIRVVSELGLTDDDVEAIRAVDGVDEIMPGYMTEIFMDAGNEQNIVTRIHSLPSDQIEEIDPQNYLNRVTVTEGRLPVQEGECVVVRSVSSHGITPSVGQMLTVSESNGDISDTLNCTQFKVVGIAETSYYFSVETESATIGDGSVALKIYTGEENFSQEAYSEIFLTVEGARELNAASDEYQAAVDAVAERIEEIADARCVARYNEVKTDAEAQLADARAELADARAEAEEKLADAEQELADGRAELEENEQLLADAKDEIESGERELEANRESVNATLNQKQQELADAQSALIDAKAQYEDGVARVEANAQEIADGWTELEAGRVELEAKRQELEASKPQLEQLREVIADIEPDVATGEAQLPALQEQLEQAQSGLEQAESAYQQAVEQSGIEALRAEAAEAQAEYETAQQKADALHAQLNEMTGDDPEYQDILAQYQAAEADAVEKKGVWDAKAAIVTNIEETVLAPIEEQIAGAQAGVETLQGAIDSINSGRTQLDSLKQQLAEGEALLAEGEALLAAGEQALAENEAKLTDGEAQLEDAKKQLEDARKQIIDAEKQIASGEISLSLAPGLAQLEFDLAQSKLDSARREYEDGMEQLEEGRAELEEGEAEYETQKADAEKKIADAEAELADAEEKLDELEVPEWHVFDHTDNVSVSSYLSNIDKLEAITTVFPIFFFLVAALVALTTMTRMVDEERLQIGTLKALGYSRGKIMFKYMFYAWVATLVGGAAGLAFGFTAIPTVIFNAYGTMYSLPTFRCVFHGAIALLGVGAALLCTSYATFSACRKTLHECAAQLLLPKAPAAGKRILLERITPVWKRMKFTHKVTARNLFRYKKRFFMTVIGIAGCTSLLVTGFGLKDSISDIISKQFDEIFTYDFILTLSRESALENEEFLELMTDSSQVQSYLAVSQQLAEQDVGGREMNAYLFVPEDTAGLSRFIDLHERKGGSLTLTDEGIVVTEKFAEEAGLSVGDVFTVRNGDDDSAAFTVTGIAENYVENYIYITPDAYRESFGEDAEINSVLCLLPDGLDSPDETFTAQILKVTGVAGLTQVASMRTSLDETIASINYVVYVIILCAGMLAFVVLYNLTNINIAERQKEIATIKVLGFYEPEVAAYIFRESSALTVIGTALGLMGGIFLHKFIMTTVEIDMVTFGKEIKLLSFVFSAALTVVFSMLVNLVMLRKLRKISMVESLKAPE